MTGISSTIDSTLKAVQDSLTKSIECGLATELLAIMCIFLGTAFSIMLRIFFSGAKNDRDRLEADIEARVRLAQATEANTILTKQNVEIVNNAMREIRDLTRRLKCSAD